MKEKKRTGKEAFILELLGDPIYKPMRLREIASLLRLDKAQRKDLYEVLDELSAEGKVVMDNKGRYEKRNPKRSVIIVPTMTAERNTKSRADGEMPARLIFRREYRLRVFLSDIPKGSALWK